ncbi:hypothetical protein AJ80_06228 [Polytolypa hystricis UAMH7299]|uniref:BTB domain-containing protein n=1 Tax=Polytolypa hystricis (strain UAMH7299) TaxID=1447883 RepID=A0A2B7XY68_POLH7|nr:hypothetical protein AJ80_06228 [Polytolypa hystricis UAMH7299]
MKREMDSEYQRDSLRMFNQSADVYMKGETYAYSTAESSDSSSSEDVPLMEEFLFSSPKVKTVAQATAAVAAAAGGKKEVKGEMPAAEKKIEGKDCIHKWTQPSIEQFQSIIRILVGPGKTQFMVHEHLLKQESTHFRKHVQFPSNTRECFEWAIEMAHIEPGTFRIFVNWLYHNTLVFPEGDELRGQTFQELADAYSLGEYLEATVFMNVIVDDIIMLFNAKNKRIPAMLTERIYASTRPESPLRKLWIALYARGEIIGNMKIQNMEFLHGIVAAQKLMLKESTSKKTVDETIKPVEFYAIEDGTGRCKGRFTVFSGVQNDYFYSHALEKGKTESKKRRRIPADKSPQRPPKTPKKKA